MRLPIQVVIYIARKTPAGWEYLMLHRKPARDEFWQAVSGGVEDGETIQETARRELGEEIGLDAEPQEIGFTFSFKVHKRWESLYEWCSKNPGELIIVAHNFVAVVDDGFKPALDGEEHDVFKWCSFDEAVETLYWDEDKEALGKVKEYLGT